MESVTPLLLTTEFWVSGVLLALIGGFGIVGNVLTLIALFKYEARQGQSCTLMRMWTFFFPCVPFAGLLSTSC